MIRFWHGLPYQGPSEWATQFDGALVLVWAFLVLFGILVFWLRREDKREGYPMFDPTRPGEAIQGFPDPPPPKIYRRLWRDDLTQMPHHYGSSAVRARRLLRFPGAPLVPIGNPLTAEVGPSAYPLREDEPLLSYGEPQVVPLRVARDWSVAKADADPRGYPVYDRRRTPAGTVVELWVDRGVKILRYLEVELAAEPGRRVLVPIYYTDVSARRRRVIVLSLLAYQLAEVPGLRDPDLVTAREEDRISAFHAGGVLFSRGTEGGLPLPRNGMETV